MKENYYLKYLFLVLMGISTSVLWGQTYTFTNSGATGAYGPTQLQCDATYGAGVVTINTQGIQEWTVPTSGNYSIETFGAQGAAGDPSYLGGQGADMYGEFSLTGGTVLKIAVGQEGIADNPSNSYNGGGGGGSFVTSLMNVPYVIAGGGGGTRSSVAQNGCDADIAEFAGTGSGDSTTHTCSLKSSGLGQGGIISSNSWGSAGGGLNSAGANDSSYGVGGSSFISGATGGTSSAQGGFGCGGSGNGGWGGGGGGGYSGGDGGRIAGGGGSYNAGINQTNIAGANSGMGYVVITKINEYPVISCPADAVADSEPGVCGAVVNFADASAIDAEDGALLTVQTAGTPLSGDVFPIGATIVEFSATDSDGATVTCQFTVTVTDVEDPMAVCQDIMVELDGLGMASITTADVDNGSSDNCGFILSLDNSSFSCADVGENMVELTITDDSGLTDTCTATVTVEDNQGPSVLCMGIEGGTFAVMEDFEAATIPADWSTVIEAGSYDWTFGSNYMPGGTNFASNAAVFDDDAAGGGEVNYVRLLSPVYNLAGFQSGSMSFEYSMQDFAGSGEMFVEVWDGSAWVEILYVDFDTTPTMFPSMDVTPYANANFQVRFSYDDNGGWAWGAGVDNFVFDYEIATTPPLEVTLDADGTYSGPLSDLLFSVDDNCGYTVSLGSGSGTACDQANASNGFENGRGCNASNGWTAANDLIVADGQNFTLSQISANIFLEVGSSITSVDVFYYDDNAGVPGAVIGSEMGVVPASQSVVGANFGFDVAEVIMNVAQFEFMGQSGSDTTYWIGITTSNTATVEIRNFWEVSTASAVGNGLAFNDGTGYVISVPAEDGVYTFGGICTSAAGSTLELDCSNLGENMIDVTVTDAGGNEATCTATVIVSDETAPVLVCGPDPLLYDTASNMVDDSPALAIPDSSAAGVTTTIEVTDEGTVLDLNVDIDITHTWVGDLIVSLTSPMGTEVVLWSQTGGSDDDIVMTFDDEGTPGAQMLSAFDGESIMGTWTLFVSDNAGGDTGTINSWGLVYDYEYSYPNPDPNLYIELGPDGTVSLVPEDVLAVMEEACAIDVMLLDITEFSCADIGTPTLVTVFANDTSGNFASCQIEVNIVDNMEPTLTCPADTTAPFDPATGTYVLPDYFGIGDAFATDNCTDVSMLVVTQDPAPGTLIGVTTSGPVVVTFTAEDENGNMATCSMNLEVATVGVNDNILETALVMYPNPATDIVKMVNNSDIALEAAIIYDLNGKLVAEIDLRNMQTETTFDVSNFASGVFMVKIIGENASTVKRLIKE